MASRDAPLLAICVLSASGARSRLAGRSRRAAVCRPRIGDALEHRCHDVPAGGMDAFRYLEQAAVRIQISAEHLEHSRSCVCAQSFGKLVRHNGCRNGLMQFAFEQFSRSARSLRTSSAFAGRA
jgi:hypothetical protein